MIAPVLPDFEYEEAAEQVRLRLVLPRLDLGTPLAPAGTTSGPECAAPGELGQVGGEGDTHR